VAAMSLAADAAWAQDDKDKDKDKSGDEEPPKPPPKKKPQAKTDKPEDERSDHERVVGHFGVSWFGVSTIPLGLGTPTGDANNPTIGLLPATTVSAPALGIRYWLSNSLGIDVGIGIGYNGGSITDTAPSGAGITTNKTDKLGAFGFLLHGGLPIALVSGKHISLQLTPETNIGFAHATVAAPPPNAAVPNPPPNASLSGIRFDLGARIGGEVQFGFIGVPELALEGSIGAFFTYQQSSVSVGPTSHTDTSMGLTTASFHNPWDFFASVVSARYYF
jgi:hypothetical protein